MNPLCKYKDMFGKPNTGVHKYRLFNIAVVDVLATIAVAFLRSIRVFVSKWIQKRGLPISFSCINIFMHE
jgi:hypothetical protein